MDRRIPAAQTPVPGDFRIDPGTDALPCPGTETAPQPIRKLGEELVRTIRHFWPDFNTWLNHFPDTRFQPFVTYDKRFLIWWGINLYLFQLGARRQLDFDLDIRDTHILTNLNRLAQTQQETRPVHKTLQHFISHTGVAAYAKLRTRMVQRLIRMKVLDAARLQGRFVVVLDATGHLAFHRAHCEHCLVQRHETYTLYLHQVLEAKILGPANLTLSIGSEFIENEDAAQAANAEGRKQDCELKALSRLLPELRREYPQLPVCLAGDALYACGRTLQLAKDHRCDYVLTFKEGQLPAVWADFQGLLLLYPNNRLEHTTPEGARQVYRWAHDLSYRDDQGRTWTFHAIECAETVDKRTITAGKETIDKQTTTFAWITGLNVKARTVVDIATKGGRSRWHIENQGFNCQKNSGLNLEHIFCIHPEWLKAYYYLLQIAHIILQIFEAGSLLRHLAAECSQTPGQLFGSLKNIARRLLESFRYFILGDEAFDVTRARRIQIRFDTS